MQRTSTVATQAGAAGAGEPASQALRREAPVLFVQTTTPASSLHRVIDLHGYPHTAAVLSSLNMLLRTDLSTADGRGAGIAIGWCAHHGRHASVQASPVFTTLAELEKFCQHHRDDYAAVETEVQARRPITPGGWFWERRKAMAP